MQDLTGVGDAVARLSKHLGCTLPTDTRCTVTAFPAPSATLMQPLSPRSRRLLQKGSEIGARLRLQSSLDNLGDVDTAACAASPLAAPEAAEEATALQDSSKGLIQSGPGYCLRRSNSAPDDLRVDWEPAASKADSCGHDGQSKALSFEANSDACLGTLQNETLLTLHRQPNEVSRSPIIGRPNVKLETSCLDSARRGRSFDLPEPSGRTAAKSVVENGETLPVQLRIDSDAAGGSAQFQTYPMAVSGWSENVPFPNIATAVNGCCNNYNSERRGGETGGGGGGGGNSNSSRINIEVLRAPPPPAASKFAFNALEGEVGTG